MSVVLKLRKLLYNENHKILLREIKVLNKWRVDPGLWVGKFSIIFKLVYGE